MVFINQESLFNHFSYKMIIAAVRWQIQDFSNEGGGGAQLRNDVTDR